MLELFHRGDTGLERDYIGRPSSRGVELLDAIFPPARLWAIGSVTLARKGFSLVLVLYFTGVHVVPVGRRCVSRCSATPADGSGSSGACGYAGRSGSGA